MMSLPRMILSALALLLLLLPEEQNWCVVCYVHSLSPATTSSRTRRKAFFRLHSSPNIFSGRTSTSRDEGGDDDKTNKQKKKRNRKNNRQNKIEFVNFWGTKISSDDNTETADPRHVPFVPTLDVRDGPLPLGAHVLEGKEEFDAKPTCRISIDVKAENIDTADDSDALVRKLQACIDAGLDTFRLYDQTPRSLAIIRKMNEETPSHIQRHWSVDLKNIHSNPNTMSTKSDLRQSVFDLVEQTGSDALDSLKVDCGNLYDTTKTLVPDEMVLEIFDHLVDLQRDGWIRSIGVRGSTESSKKLRREITSYFGDHIDFEEQEGNLLLPPPDLYIPQNNLRMSNALAGRLLTDLYNSNDRRRRKFDHRPSQPLLTKDNIQLLNEWSKRRKTQQASESVPIWKEYQDDIVCQLGWIALKHDVSISAVALRWALQCGGSGVIGEGPVVSSVLADIDFDDPKGEFTQKLIELREVFRFQLEEEDKDILSDISPSYDLCDFNQNDGEDFPDFDFNDLNENPDDEEGYPDIDFNNPTLWL